MYVLHIVLYNLLEFDALVDSHGFLWKKVIFSLMIFWWLCGTEEHYTHGQFTHLSKMYLLEYHNSNTTVKEKVIIPFWTL